MRPYKSSRWLPIREGSRKNRPVCGKPNAVSVRSQDHCGKSCHLGGPLDQETQPC
jgi:hypothetical protein